MVLIDEIAVKNEDARRSAVWLLDHSQEGQHFPWCRFQHTSGPEVQQRLLLACNVANRIDAKGLMPFLSMLIEAASAA